MQYVDAWCNHHPQVHTAKEQKIIYFLVGKAFQRKQSFAQKNFKPKNLFKLVLFARSFYLSVTFSRIFPLTNLLQSEVVCSKVLYTLTSVIFSALLWQNERGLMKYNCLQHSIKRLLWRFFFFTRYSTVPSVLNFNEKRR